MSLAWCPTGFALLPAAPVAAATGVRWFLHPKAGLECLPNPFPHRLVFRWRGRCASGAAYPWSRADRQRLAIRWRSSARLEWQNRPPAVRMPLVPGVGGPRRRPDGPRCWSNLALFGKIQPVAGWSNATQPCGLPGRPEQHLRELRFWPTSSTWNLHRGCATRSAGSEAFTNRSWSALLREARICGRLASGHSVCNRWQP